MEQTYKSTSYRRFVHPLHMQYLKYIIKKKKQTNIAKTAYRLIKMNKQIDQLHAMFKDRVIYNNFLFTHQPLKRGAWFCCITNLTNFELMLNKLIKKSRRVHRTNSFVTNLFSSCVFKVFVEESMMLSDPDLMSNIMASSPELPQ